MAGHHQHQSYYTSYGVRLLGERQGDGEWGQEGFNTFAIDGDGQKLFEQMEQLTPGEQWAELRGDGFYIFKCLHCDKMRSFSDCD